MQGPVRPLCRMAGPYFPMLLLQKPCGVVCYLLCLTQQDDPTRVHAVGCVAGAHGSVGNSTQDAWAMREHWKGLFVYVHFRSSSSALTPLPQIQQLSSLCMHVAAVGSALLTWSDASPGHPSGHPRPSRRETTQAVHRRWRYGE